MKRKKPASIICFLIVWSGSVSFSLAWSQKTVQEVGGGESVAESIDKLLGELWDGRQNAAADSFGQTAMQRYPGDADLAYAVALNRMNNRRYREASEALGKVIESRPNHLEAIQLFSYAQAVLREFDRSLILLKQLRKGMTETGKETELDKKRTERFFTHAGRMAGFMQGPAGGKPNADLLKSVISDFLSDATAEQAEWFNNEMKTVLEDFAQMSKDQSLATEKILAETAEQKAAETARINTENLNLEQREMQIRPELNQLTADASAVLAEFDRQSAPLSVQANAAELTANQLALNLSQMRGQAVLLEQALLYEEDWALRFSIRQQLGFLYSSIQNTNNQLLNAQNALYGLHSQLNSLAMQRGRAEAQYGAQIAQKQSELSEVNRLKRRNQRTLDKLKKPGKVMGEAFVIAEEKDNLSTYHNLSIELFRLWFIESREGK